ncbi:unnamed protein product [Pieris macdunnoughi]|uniref:Uncharacterized protein n=1 Tax=Pieris macdunnoughi TaxID=345717 RepID=A0A821QSZ7_9NEOP|nr:unnamed protein product [Pieris macdunnoughi]
MDFFSSSYETLNATEEFPFFGQIAHREPDSMEKLVASVKWKAKRHGADHQPAGKIAILSITAALKEATHRKKWRRSVAG